MAVQVQTYTAVRSAVQVPAYMAVRSALWTAAMGHRTCDVRGGCETLQLGLFCCRSSAYAAHAGCCCCVCVNLSAGKLSCISCGVCVDPVAVLCSLHRHPNHQFVGSTLSCLFIVFALLRLTWVSCCLLPLARDPRVQPFEILPVPKPRCWSWAPDACCIGGCANPPRLHSSVSL